MAKMIYFIERISILYSYMYIIVCLLFAVLSY